MEKRQRYDAAFKKEIASVYNSGSRSAQSLAHEIGVHENTIYKWGEQFRSDPENAFPGTGNLKPEEDERRRLARRIKELEGGECHTKKSGGILRKEQSLRYRFIHGHRFEWTVQKLCRVLQVSRSGYYGWVKAGCPNRKDKDAVLLAKIRLAERANHNNLGVERMHRELRESYDTIVSRRRVQRVMHENGIKARRSLKYKPQTTKVDAGARAYDNLLTQDFTVQLRGQVWLPDITYIRVAGKWAYLAVVLDLYDRMPIG